MSLLEQFKRFLMNEMNNPSIDDNERVEFSEVFEIVEDGIELIAETDAGTFIYEYNCYNDTGETQLFEFSRA